MTGLNPEVDCLVEIAVVITDSELNILDDAALFEDYQSLIPVVRVNEKTVATWRVDAESLRAAIIEESA